MAALLRTSTTRLLLQLTRSSAQPVCLSRPFCQVPPEDSKEGKKAAATAADDEDNVKKNESQELLQGKNVESKTEGNVPAEEAKENLNKQLNESIVNKKGEIPSDRRTSKQKKLYDLLTSLARADPMPVEPTIRLSHPKPKKKKAKKTDAPSQPPESEHGLEPEMVSAAKEVAETLGGDVKETESELLSTLRLHSTETTASDAPSLSKLFVGMKVERKPKPESERAPHQLASDSIASHPQHLLNRDQPHRHRSFNKASAASTQRTRVDLFGGKPLGIFDKSQDKSPAVSMVPTWERLRQHEIQQSVSHPPSNAFVEMIQWTNEGKVWTFPIDNETGLEEEKKIGFHEHVFLEKHLEGWCPQRGPIRHFMELVCVGLSKNPYLTVQRKKAHIEWYKNYFKQKEDLLKELGAIQASM